MHAKARTQETETKKLCQDCWDTSRDAKWQLVFNILADSLARVMSVFFLYIPSFFFVLFLFTGFL